MTEKSPHPTPQAQGGESKDRELLERAARAAGLTLRWGESQIIGDTEVDCTDLAETDQGPWDPLWDDGDALRLAVRLKMAVTIGQRNAISWLNRDEFRVEKLDDDPMAATRRAIVRAAAAMAPDSAD